MADLFDYLDWRADVPFSAAPFNDADNLILSTLVYADLEGIVPPDGHGVSIQDVQKSFFETPDRS